MAITTYKTFLMIKNETTNKYEKLVDIKDYPDLGGTPEMVESTTLSDRMKTFELGIENLEALEFTANYTPADFEKVKAIERTKQEFAVWFGGKETAGEVIPDGSLGIFAFPGSLSAFPVGGGVNAIVDMKISIAPSAPITYGLGVEA